jgi:putative SOS response-associated peptidase YedK
MCGRYTFFSPSESVTRLFDTPVPVSIEARYNIAPTQFVPAIRLDPQGQRQLVMLHWGLVPSWAREKAIGNRMINARAETLAEKPSFKKAFSQRRCLVLTSGFYEWRKEGGAKRPYFISRKDSEPIAMAGLWEGWRQETEPLESCTIITTEANDFMQALHHRMPAMLAPEDCGRWLDSKNVGIVEAADLLRPLQEDSLQAWPVSTRVNSPRNEGAELLDPVA